jgi:hypothetical protein
VNKPLSAISRSKLTPSSASSSRPSSRDQPQRPHLPSLTGQQDDQSGGGYDNSEPHAWSCLKCNFLNTRSMDYCDKCAVVRGADGRRGLGAAIRRV